MGAGIWASRRKGKIKERNGHYTGEKRELKRRARVFIGSSRRALCCPGVQKGMLGEVLILMLCYLASWAFLSRTLLYLLGCLWSDHI